MDEEGEEGEGTVFFPWGCVMVCWSRRRRKGDEGVGGLHFNRIFGAYREPETRNNDVNPFRSRFAPRSPCTYWTIRWMIKAR